MTKMTSIPENYNSIGGPLRIRQSPNKVLAAKYRTVLPDEEPIAKELERSRRELDKRTGL